MTSVLQALPHMRATLGVAFALGLLVGWLWRHLRFQSARATLLRAARTRFEQASLSVATLEREKAELERTTRAILESVLS